MIRFRSLIEIGETHANSIHDELSILTCLISAFKSNWIAKQKMCVFCIFLFAQAEFDQSSPAWMLTSDLITIRIKANKTQFFVCLLFFAMKPRIHIIALRHCYGHLAFPSNLNQYLYNKRAWLIKIYLKPNVCVCEWNMKRSWNLRFQHRKGQLNWLFRL